MAGMLVVRQSRNTQKRERGKARCEGLYSQNRGTQIAGELKRKW
jgi:hypothetical protein